MSGSIIEEEKGEPQTLLYRQEQKLVRRSDSEDSSELSDGDADDEVLSKRSEVGEATALRENAARLAGRIMNDE